MRGCTSVKRVERKDKDKYGQNYKLICSCGIETAWHTDFDRAYIALGQNHEYARRMERMACE